MSNDATLDPRTEKAITCALEGKWDEAIEINQSLLENYPEDIESRNRLARAFSEVGKINKARSLYQEVLKLDPYNPIAGKNIKKLSNIKPSKTNGHSASTVLDPNIFLEEPGKTRVINAVDLASPSILATLKIGDEIILDPNRNEVIVLSKTEKRLGKLEQPWGEKIADSLRLGNEYMGVIKATNIKNSASQSDLAVFVRETVRKDKNPIIFPPTNNFTPYLSEDALTFINNQNPTLIETDGEVEEVEIQEITKEETETPSESLESLAEDEMRDNSSYDEED